MEYRSYKIVSLRNTQRRGELKLTRKRIAYNPLYFYPSPYPTHSGAHDIFSQKGCVSFIVPILELLVK